MLWVLGITLVVFNGETLWTRWREGGNYRHVKATMDDNPIAMSIVRATSKYYEVHPLTVVGFVSGVLLLLTAIIKG